MNVFSEKYEDTIRALIMEIDRVKDNYELDAYLPKFNYETDIKNSVTGEITSETFDVFTAIDKKTGKKMYISYSDNDTIKITGLGQVLKYWKKCIKRSDK